MSATCSVLRPPSSNFSTGQAAGRRLGQLRRYLRVELRLRDAHRGEAEREHGEDEKRRCIGRRGYAEIRGAGTRRHRLQIMAKQRQVRIEQKSALAAMSQLEERSDDELLSETKFRAAAQAILGARAAERYDAQSAREHFRKAIAAARPQERMQLRRMAEASLALAERRPDDLKAAVEKLGQQAPSNRQLFVLRLMGLISPAQGASKLMRVRGGLIILAMVVALLVVGFGVATLLLLPFGGSSALGAIAFGVVIVIVALAVLAFVGKRKQTAARQKARAARAG